MECSNDQLLEYIHQGQWDDIIQVVSSLVEESERKDVVSLISNHFPQLIFRLLDESKQKLSDSGNAIDAVDAVEENKARKLLLILTEIGGKEFLLNKRAFIQVITGGLGNSRIEAPVLIYAINLGIDFDLMSSLIDVGGKDLIIEKDDDDYFRVGALYWACRRQPNSDWSLTLELVTKLTDVGGKEIVVENDSYYSMNPLRWVMVYSDRRSGDEDIIRKLIDVGGKDLIIQQEIGTALRLSTFECTFLDPRYKYTVDTIMKAIDVGGKDIALQKNQYDEHRLTSWCKNDSTDIKVLSKLIDLAGRQFFEEVKYSVVNEVNRIDVCTILIRKYIEFGLLFEPSKKNMGEARADYFRNKYHRGKGPRRRFR